MFFGNKAFSQWRLLKQCEILFLSRSSNFNDDEEFLCGGESKIIEYSTFNLNEMTESECLSEFRFGNRDIPMRYLFSI